MILSGTYSLVQVTFTKDHLNCMLWEVLHRTAIFHVMKIDQLLTMTFDGTLKSFITDDHCASLHGCKDKCLRKCQLSFSWLDVGHRRLTALWTCTVWGWGTDRRRWSVDRYTLSLLTHAEYDLEQFTSWPPWALVYNYNCIQLAKFLLVWKSKRNTHVECK